MTQMVIRQKCYTGKEIETAGTNPIKFARKTATADDDDDRHREQRFQEKLHGKTRRET